MLWLWKVWKPASSGLEDVWRNFSGGYQSKGLGGTIRILNFLPGSRGVHSGGHYTIGGDAGSDFYNSPADPAFYFHHRTIDRVWTWQNLDLEKG